MSDQDNGQVSTLQRPTTNDPEAWKAYWKEKGWTWRTEPEIDAERQKYLAERRTIVPDIEKGIYPFKDVKLNRADVEWLLATHENGRGPVDWHDESQREREGLDLRGAVLRRVNLRGLPLARMKGGLAKEEWSGWNKRELKLAVVYMEATNLTEAKLQGATLRQAELRGSRLFQASLQKAFLLQAHLQHADLLGADLQEANLCLADLEKADLYNARLQGADLKQANLQGTVLTEAHLQGADLRHADFEGASLSQIALSDEEYGTVRLVDVNWSNANLAVVEWEQVKRLGDEEIARQKKDGEGKTKEKQDRLSEYKGAARANRQLAVALQSQGLNDDASRFAYRAQLCQRIVLRLQKKFGQYFFSLLLDLLAGYGYRPGRSVLWYLAVIFGFALAYHFLGGLTLYPPDAFVFSVMSFHGRGFFPALSQETNLHNPLVMLAAAEAIIGLLIEISFIATFTQRFFGR